MRIAVVGGGLTGLAAAHELIRAGHEAVLLEAGDRLGGVIRTVVRDGFLIETGPESFTTRKPAILDLCRRLGLEGELLFGRSGGRTAVYARGRLRPLPDGVGILPTRLGPLLASGVLGPLEKLRLAADLLLPPSAGEGDRSLDEVVRRRLGSAALDRLVAPIAAGIYAADPRRLSLEATFPEILQAARRGSLFRHAARGPAPGRGGPAFATLRGGLGCLVERLEMELAAADVRVGARVDAVTQGGSGGCRLELAGGGSLEADGAILAVPAVEAARLLSASAAEAARHLQALRRLTSVVVTLGYRAGDVPLAGNGFVVARDAGLPVTACTFSSSKWPGRAPPGYGLLRVYLGRAGDPVDPASDDAELIDRARAGLGAATGWTADPVLTRVDRWLGAMPQYDVGHLARVTAAESALAEALPAALLAGADYRGVGLSDCAAQGRAAAARVADPVRGDGGAAAGDRVQ